MSSTNTPRPSMLRHPIARFRAMSWKKKIGTGLIGLGFIGAGAALALYVFSGLGGAGSTKNANFSASWSAAGLMTSENQGFTIKTTSGGTASIASSNFAPPYGLPDPGSVLYTSGGNQLDPWSAAGQARACGSAALSADAKTLTFTPGTGALPGDVCDVVAEIDASNMSVDGVLTGIKATGLGEGWELFLDGSSTFNNGSVLRCGDTITKGTATTKPVDIALVDDNAPLDGSASGPITFNLTVSPASQVTTPPVSGYQGGTTISPSCFTANTTAQ